MRISKYYLRLVYSKGGIKKKLIRQGKDTNPQLHERIREQAIQANQELEHHIEHGFRICYLDEFVISKSTIPRSDWSARRSYNRVDLRQFHKKTIAAIATISKEAGTELVCTFDKSVNREKIIIFLKKLRQKHPFTKLALYLDQLSVHKTKEVKKVAE